MPSKKQNPSFPPAVDAACPVAIIDDSKAIAMKLQNHVEKLGYYNF